MSLTKTPPRGNETDESDPVAYWIQNKVWHEAYIKQGPGNQKITMRRFLARDGLLAKTKCLPSWEGSESRSVDPDTRDQYNNIQAFIQLLEQHGSFKRTLEFKIDNKNQEFCKTLLDNQQKPPRESLFDDDMFQRTCKRVAREIKQQ